MVIAQAQEGVRRHLDDLLGRRRRHLFDVYAALAGRHHHDAPAGTVEHCAQVDLLGDVGRRVDQHLAHLEPLDGHAQNGVGVLLGFVERPGKLDAACLAAPADQHL